MSGVHRFLSRRDKKRPDVSKAVAPKKSEKPSSRPEYFPPIFTLDDEKPPADKEEEQRISSILERFRQYGIDSITRSNVRYALRATASLSDGEAAFRLLMLLQETYEGEVKPFDPNVTLVGAVNREATTCYLDALLFSMFARLDSFEAMLYDSFDDLPRKRLAGLLRLWVNMLRTGHIITVDLTQFLQDAIGSCGWNDAARTRQQDPSEAFNFIAGQLELPLLTLKMDLFHTGKEDQDDHKFVNERLLEVAIVDQPQDSGQDITLEDCLEHYFNNRIEVKRYMENQRRNTLKSASLPNPNNSVPIKVEKDSGIHIEIAEVSSAPSTPITQSPLVDTPISSKQPSYLLRPGLSDRRTESIFSQRRIGVIPNRETDTETQAETEAPKMEGNDLPPERKMSTRTEVLMPAWQFFKLLPWYTYHLPESDAQVAAHFSQKRPVLGICLKRYSFTNEGRAIRRDTYVDIPLEIAVPNFVSDDDMEEGRLTGNFRLLLQSVVCHRGNNLHSGHYICLVRGQASEAGQKGQDTAGQREYSGNEDSEDPWMRFDDLATPRVNFVDIDRALKQETPYMLFYQVQPIGEDGKAVHNLPTYAEATSRSQSTVTLSEKPTFVQPVGPEPKKSEPTMGLRAEIASRSSRVIDKAVKSDRTSLDIGTFKEVSRGRSQFQGEERCQSVGFDASSASRRSSYTDPTLSASTTPADEKDKHHVPNLLSVAAAKSVARRSLSRRARSQPSAEAHDLHIGNSDGGNHRFSMNMSRMTHKLGRTATNGSASGAASPPTMNAEPDTHDSRPSDTNTSASPVIIGSQGKPLPFQTDKGNERGAQKSSKTRLKGKRGANERECTIM